MGDHIRDKHSKGKTRYKTKTKYQYIEEHRQKYIYDLCNEEFDNESKLKQHGGIDHKVHEENKISYSNGLAVLAEEIMNGEKRLEDLLNYITGHKELDLDLDLELEPEGLVRHAQPKEIRKNRRQLIDVYKAMENLEKYKN